MSNIAILKIIFLALFKVGIRFLLPEFCPRTITEIKEIMKIGFNTEIVQ